MAGVQASKGKGDLVKEDVLKLAGDVLEVRLYDQEA